MKKRLAVNAAQQTQASINVTQIFIQTFSLRVSGLKVLSKMDTAMERKISILTK